MKIKQSLASAILLSALFAAGSARAVNHYWVGGLADDDMSAVGNWNPDTSVPANNNYSDLAFFTESAATKTPFKIKGGNIAYAGFIFENSTGWVIGTLTNGSLQTGTRVESSGVGTNTIIPKVESYSNGQWRIGEGNTLHMAGGVGWDSNTSQLTLFGPGTLLLTGGGTGYNNAKPAIIKGNLILGGTLGDSARYWVNATGRLDIAASGTFANQLTIGDEGVARINGFTNSVSSLFIGASPHADVKNNEGGTLELGTGRLNINMATIKGGRLTSQPGGELAVNAGAYLVPNSMIFLESENPSIIQADIRLQSNGTDCAIVSSNSAAAVIGDITETEAAGVPTKGITKLGPGALSITGNLDFSRAIRVQEGSLFVNGATIKGTEAVIVTNAVFGGNHVTSRPLDIRAGGALTPGENNEGEFLASNNATFSAGSAINYATKDSVAKLTISSGALAINAPIDINVTLEDGFTPISAVIFDATGSTGDFDLSLFNFNVSGNGSASFSINERVITMRTSQLSTLMILR